MKRLVTIILLSLSVISCGFCVAEPVTPISVMGKTWDVDYEVLLPSDFDKTTKYPLIFVLHGKGARIKYMTEFWAKSGATEEGYIIVCPQLKHGEDVLYSWIFARIDRMLQVIKKKYRIDENNIFLTGFSAGAEAAIYYAITEPQNFKAVALAGGSIRDEVLELPYYNSYNIKKLNLYILHAEDDYEVPLSECEYMVDFLKKHGANVVFETIKGGHYYEEQEVEKTLAYFNSQKTG